MFRLIALRKYQKALLGKHKELHIPFRPGKPLELSTVYVPLRVVGSSDGKEIDDFQAVSKYRRLMIKGPPDSGKSVLLRHLALTYATRGFESFPDNPAALLFELHRMNDSKQSLKDHLIETLARNDFSNAENFLSQSLKQGTLMLLFDGLDEVNRIDRNRVVREIKDLLEKYRQCRVLITCRTAVYRGEFDDGVDQILEISEFNDQQIRHFLSSWEPDMPPDKSIKQLMNTLHDRPKLWHWREIHYYSPLLPIYIRIHPMYYHIPGQNFITNPQMCYCGSGIKSVINMKPETSV